MAKAASTVVIGHWSQLLSGFSTTPKQFYDSVEDKIFRRGIPKAKNSRVDWREGGFFTVKREYLRIRRNEFVFDICGAPFGNDFFVSWWLGEVPSGFRAFLSGLPLIGWLFGKFVRPVTYYRIDTALMFQSAIHRAVQDVIDEWTEERGLRALTELERKPILKTFFE